MKKPNTPIKKLLCICLMMVMYSATNAQFIKGTKLLGGSLSYSRTKQNYFDDTIDETIYDRLFYFKPSVGYFITKNLAIGAGVGLITASTHTKDKIYKRNSTGLGIFPFVRYYIHPKIYLLAEAGVDESKSKEVYSFPVESSFTYHSSSRYLNLSVGYVKFLNESVAIETEVGYKIWNYKNTGDGIISTKASNVSLFIGIALQFYLRKNSKV